MDVILNAAKTKPLSACLLELDNAAFFTALNGLYENCEKAQSAVLLEMVERCKDTEFGRKYGFENIKTVSDYRERVPLLEWDDFKEYSNRMKKGEGDLIFDGKAEFFYFTSGTTSELKYIPKSASETIARKALLRARIMYMTGIMPIDKITKVLVLPNTSGLDKTEGGIPTGSTADETADMAGGVLGKVMALPVNVCDEFMGDDMNYMLLRCALIHPAVSAVTVNSALRFIQLAEYGAANADGLISDIANGTCKLKCSEKMAKDLEYFLKPNKERAEFLQKLHEQGKFYPKYYWEGLTIAAFWLGGSVGTFVDEAKKYLPGDIKWMDLGYGASEVKVNIPMKPGTAAGVLCTFSGFFEFLPEDGGVPLLAHELEDKKRYELVVTTYGGLYRYKMHDLVQVEGFTGTTPNIYFVSKTGDVGNMNQEKLPGTTVALFVRNAAKEFNVEIKALQAVTDFDNLRYTICVEIPNPDALDKEAFEKAVEQELLKDGLYRYVRESQRLNPSNVVFMKDGWRQELLSKYTKGNASISRVKIPVIVSSVSEEWIYRPQS